MHKVQALSFNGENTSLQGYVLVMKSSLIFDITRIAHYADFNAYLCKCFEMYYIGVGCNV